MSRGSEEGEPLMQMVGDEGGGFKGSLGEEEGVLEGRVVAVKNNFYFLRMDSAQEHANVFGKKDIFLRQNKIKNNLLLEEGARVKFKSIKTHKGPEAVWAEVIQSKGDKRKSAKSQRKDTGNGLEKKDSRDKVRRLSTNKAGWVPAGFRKGFIAGSTVDKSGQLIYFVRENNTRKNNKDDDIFLHGSRLPTTDKFFKLSNGTSLYFKLKAQNGRRPEIGQVELEERRYDLHTLLADMLDKLDDNPREIEITSMLRSVPAWQFIGANLKKRQDIESFIKIQNAVVEICRASEKLLQDAMGAALKGDLLCKDGPLKAYMVSVPVEDRNKHMVLELFENIVKLKTNHSGQVIRLLQVWVEEDADPLLVSMFKMLKSLCTHYQKNRGEMDTDLLDYHEIPLIPTTAEISSNTKMESQSNLLAVKRGCGYHSEEEYMETYFNLQRAEGYSDLCNGIKEFNAGSLDHRDMNVYKNIALQGMAFQNSRISLALRVESVKEVKDLSLSRYLMSGNLLCLTIKGDFSDPIWAKVSVRHEETLKKFSTILVELLPEHNARPTFSIILSLLAASGKVMMAEAPTFYQSFGPVLRSLQKYDISLLPIKDSIVSCEKTSLEPSYLVGNKVKVEPLLAASKPIISSDNMHVKRARQMNQYLHGDQEDENSGDLLSIPSLITALKTDTKLDDTQKEAIQHALTHRVAIIQGPPGAGKTFLGTKIVEILVNLSKPSAAPILVITYKNHALDEFLKGLIDNKVCSINDICRIGGRSKEPELEACQLYKVLGRGKGKAASDMQRNIYDLNDEIRDLQEDLKNATQEFSCDLGLVEEDVVEGLEDDQLARFITNNGNDQSIYSVMQKAIFESQATLQDICKGNYNKNGNCQRVCLQFRTKFKKWKPTSQHLRQFKTNLEMIRESLVNQRLVVYQKRSDEQQIADQKDKEEDAEDVEDAAEWHNERLELMKVSGKGVTKEEAPVITSFYQNKAFLFKYNDFPEDCPLEPGLLNENIDQLGDQDKIKFLYALLVKVQANSKEKINQLILDLELLLERKDELEAMYRAEEVSKMKIIGMTITGASINNSLVKLLMPEVVLVEEAAEILEPQLLVALTPNLKHLIMIGDHHQLPPQVNTYTLKKKYHFDTSMMQRLVENKLPFVQLTLQNRMRPEIAELLSDIYPNLKSNIARVGSIPLPKILANSSYFWSHSAEECSERSKSNPEEVDRALSLGLLLVTYGHKPSEITILCAYLGQTSLMKRKLMEYMKRFPDLVSKEDQFTISTVDNYQGDENNIVIVSLVRGNGNGSVGFLSERPRRCVAQSRAKSCVIFIGNEGTVRSASCWRWLMGRVQILGPRIEISCPKHPTSSVRALTDALDANQLLDNPASLCTVACKELFPCDKVAHACKKKCQPAHKHTKCRTKVRFDFPRCGHPGVKECWEEDKKKLCLVMIKFFFIRCKHPDTRACHKGSETERVMKCKSPCEEMMDCGKHPCNRTCGEIHSHSDCKAMVNTIISCGHDILKKCSASEQTVRCLKEVTRIFPVCQHSKKMECHQSIKDFTCQEKVRAKLACTHMVVHKCCEDKTSVSCQAVCDKVLRCNHVCRRHCGEPCADCIECIERAKKQMEIARKDAEAKAAALIQQIKRSDNQGVAFSKNVTDQSEFDSIKGLVINFIQPEHDWFPMITKIERVVNPKLEKEWWEAKSRLFDPARGEERKFHGTGEDGVQGICFGDGFRLPAPSTNNMFGQGIYFASNSSKSARDLYTKGSNKLLLCKVLLGKSYTAHSAKNDLTPQKVKQMGFDSVYAPPYSSVQNDEFIVYDPRQALPSYIIHFVKGSVNNLMTKLPSSSSFKVTNVKPKRTMNETDPYEAQFMIAESRFHRLQTNTRHRIVSIDIVENPSLEAKFQQKRDEFKRAGIPPEGSDPILAFHGTKLENINPILRNNFDLAKFKVGVHGFGIYFSEQPEVSTGYASNCNSMILCKILQGRVGVNCKEVVMDRADERCWAIVVGETNGRRDDSTMNQILPAYVINYN